MSAAKSFIWYELMTTDIEAAEAFYRAVIGWDARDAGQPGMRYTVMSAGTAMVAGVMALPDGAGAAGMRPGWVGYIHAPDVDAAVASLRRAGGAVHREPTDIPGIGRFAAVADPQGAVFMLFQPMGGGDAPALRGTPGHVGWHELYAADWTSAFAFYAGEFGWTKADAIDMGPMGTYQLFAAGGEPIGGMMDKMPQMPAPAWQYYVNVDDIDAAASRVTEAGGQILMAPHEVPGGSWIVQCMDPQGAMFALVAQPH